MTDALTRTTPAAPWEPLPAESADEFAAFWAWLQTRPRPAPADVNPNLPLTWRQRAEAWDLQVDLLAATGGTLEARRLVVLVGTGLLTVMGQEMIKAVQRSRLGSTEMSVKDIVAALALLKDAGLAAQLNPPAQGGTTLDMNDPSLTEEERELIVRAELVKDRIRRMKK